MVQNWIHLKNNQITKSCQNKRILRIFKNSEVLFYGDYDLDIYIGTKHDYESLESVIYKVISKSDGWINNHNVTEAKLYDNVNLLHYINKCGDIPYKEFTKMFPRKEDYNVIKGLKLRDDGNFLIYGCETTRFYYVICFATS